MQSFFTFFRLGWMDRKKSEQEREASIAEAKRTRSLARRKVHKTTRNAPSSQAHAAPAQQVRSQQYSELLRTNVTVQERNKQALEDEKARIGSKKEGKKKKKKSQRKGMFGT